MHKGSEIVAQESLENPAVRGHRYRLRRPSSKANPRPNGQALANIARGSLDLRPAPRRSCTAVSGDSAWRSTNESKSFMALDALHVRNSILIAERIEVIYRLSTDLNDGLALLIAEVRKVGPHHTHIKVARIGVLCIRCIPELNIRHAILHSHGHHNRTSAAFKAFFD